MPELPEVETTVQGIKSYLLNKTITNCKVLVTNLRWELQKDLSKNIINLKITKVNRRAKYIIISGKNSFLTIHLGMTGTLRIAKKNDVRKKHDHFEIYLNSNLIIIFNDPRKFGMIFHSNACPLLTNRLLMRLGPEPLSKEFDGEYLYQISRNKDVAIKSLLMNSNLVVGIGNIYASECLFLSKIRPQKISKKLSKNNCIDLVKCIKKVLKIAIKKGGSSINDYFNVNGKSGYFQFDFRVYGRELLPCYICENKILKININQRSSFYCKYCQK